VYLFATIDHIFANFTTFISFSPDLGRNKGVIKSVQLSVQEVEPPHDLIPEWTTYRDPILAQNWHKEIEKMVPWSS